MPARPPTNPHPAGPQPRNKTALLFTHASLGKGGKELGRGAGGAPHKAGACVLSVVAGGGGGGGHERKGRAGGGGGAGEGARARARTRTQGDRRGRGGEPSARSGVRKEKADTILQRMPHHLSLSIFLVLVFGFFFPLSLSLNNQAGRQSQHRQAGTQRDRRGRRQVARAPAHAHRSPAPRVRGFRERHTRRAGGGSGAGRAHTPSHTSHLHASTPGEVEGRVQALVMFFFTPPALPICGGGCGV